MPLITVYYFTIMHTPKDIANFFLCLSEPDVGDVLSNLKIQKLVYYAQGFHLAIFGTPLFEDPILAWEHGPVVPSLYYEFKQYGSGQIPVPEEFDTDIFSKEQNELLLEVNQVFGQFSAWKLRNMTHSERPWNETDRNQEISHGLMKDYFKTQLID